MPNGDPAQEIADLISSPLEALLVSLGSGIGRSQAELDRHSIETQRRIDEDPVLAQYGLQATWYQIPRTELELKVAVAMERGQEVRRDDVATPPPLEPAGTLVGGRLFERPLPRLFVQPVNARYSNQFHYDVNAASTVKLTITAVPPAGEAAAGRPTQTEAAILERAAPHLVEEAGAPAGRVTVNFNAGQRAWYVVQTREDGDEVQLLTLLKVLDTDEREIVKQTGGR